MFTIFVVCEVNALMLGSEMWVVSFMARWIGESSPRDRPNKEETDEYSVCDNGPLAKSLWC